MFMYIHIYSTFISVIDEELWKSIVWQWRYYETKKFVVLLVLKSFLNSYILFFRFLQVFRIIEVSSILYFDNNTIRYLQNVFSRKKKKKKKKKKTTKKKN